MAEKKYLFGKEQRSIKCISCEIYTLGCNPRLIAVHYTKEKGVTSDFSLVLLKHNFNKKRDLIIKDNIVEIKDDSIKEEVDYNFDTNLRSIVHNWLNCFFNNQRVFFDDIVKDDEIINREKNCIYLVKEKINDVDNENVEKIIQKDNAKDKKTKEEDKKSSTKEKIIIKEFDDSIRIKSSYVQTGIEAATKEKVFNENINLLTKRKYTYNNFDVFSSKLIATPVFSIEFPCFKENISKSNSKNNKIYDELSNHLNDNYLVLCGEYGTGKHTLVNKYIENNLDINTVIYFDLNGQFANKFTDLKPISTNIIGKYNDENNCFWRLLEKSKKDVIIVLDNYDEQKNKFLLSTINNNIIGNAKLIVISNNEHSIIRPTAGFSIKEIKDFVSFKEYINDIANKYLNNNSSKIKDYSDFLNKINFNLNALVKYSKDFENSNYKSFDEFIDKYDETIQFNKYSLVDNYINYSCDEDAIDVFRLLFILPNFYRNIKTVTNVMCNNNHEINKYKSILYGLNSANIIRINNYEEISIDPYIEKYLYENKYLHYKDNIINSSITNYIDIVKNILLSNEYRTIKLLFITLDKYSKFNYDNKFILRKKVLSNDFRGLLENIISKNNRNVDAKKVVSNLIPSHIEHLIFFDTELFVSNKPEHKSLILKNKRNLAIYDCDEDKTYILQGKAMLNYEVVGHFGVFKEGIYDGKDMKSFKPIKLPSFIKTYKYDALDYKNKIANTNKKIYSAYDARTAKSTFDLDKFSLVYKSALQESIFKYQSLGSDNDLWNLLTCLNQQIVYYNMLINYRIFNENIDKYVSISEGYMRSLDFILSLDGLPLNEADIADRKIGMSYHRGVLEYHKGCIENSIDYYKNGIAITRDYLDSHNEKDDNYYDMIYTVSFNANQIGNCCYERLTNEYNDDLFFEAEKHYLIAIDYIDKYCNYLKKKNYYPAVKGLYYNNLGRLYTLNKLYYQGAYSCFKKAFNLINKYKDIDTRIADYKVAYLNNINELMQNDDVNKYSEEILHNYYESYKLIEKYNLNNSVKAFNYNGYIKYKIKIHELLDSEIEELYEIKKGLNINNPRHMQRLKEINQTELLIKQYRK